MPIEKHCFFFWRRTEFKYRVWLSWQINGCLLSQHNSLMGQCLNSGQTGSFHIPKIHCSLIMLSLEAMNFEIKSVLNTEEHILR